MARSRSQRDTERDPINHSLAQFKRKAGIDVRRFTILTPAVVLVALGAGVRETCAQEVPYKTKGTGVYSPATGDFSGTGTGTHMGKHSFFGNVMTSKTADPLVFNFSLTAPQQTVAANGDVLYFSGSGQVQLYPLDSTFTTFTAIWSGQYEVVGGTGRFANVAPGGQPLQVTATNDPFALSDPEWTFSWTVEGEILLH
jgi:hypothetical protein